MAEMVIMVAAWFPDRHFILVVDSLDSGKSVLSKLPENVDLIGPVHAKAALYGPAPKEPAVHRGPRRKKGDRLKDAAAWEDDSSRWQTLHYDQYGLHGSLRVKTRTGLYYKAGNDRLLRLVLSQDTVGQRPTRIFYCTDLTMFLHSLTIVWFASEGHSELQFPNRPWYHWKSEPSFADMLTTLRRKS